MKLPTKTLDDTGGDGDANADQDQPTEKLTALARLDPNPGTQLQAD